MALLYHKRPQVRAGHPERSGSHSYLTDDFIHGILVPDHKICVDVVTALNMTIAGVYAHRSAMRGGESIKIPEISL